MKAAEGVLTNLCFFGAFSPLLTSWVPSRIRLRSSSTKTFQSVACGTSHIAALSKDGRKLLTFGSNVEMQLGATLGPTVYSDTTTPHETNLRKGFGPASAVACGAAFTIVYDVGGTALYVFGSNKCGQLFLTPSDAEVPQPVELADFEEMGAKARGGVSAVVCGGEHTVVLLRDGSCWAVGNNRHAQLGIGEDDAGTIWRPRRVWLASLGLGGAADEAAKPRDEDGEQSCANKGEAEVVRPSMDPSIGIVAVAAGPSSTALVGCDGVLYYAGDDLSPAAHPMYQFPHKFWHPPRSPEPTDLSGAPGSGGQANAPDDSTHATVSHAHSAHVYFRGAVAAGSVAAALIPLACVWAPPDCQASGAPLSRLEDPGTAGPDSAFDTAKRSVAYLVGDLGGSSGVHKQHGTKPRSVRQLGQSDPGLVRTVPLSLCALGATRGYFGSSDGFYVTKPAGGLWKASDGRVIDLAAGWDFAAYLLDPESLPEEDDAAIPLPASVEPPKALLRSPPPASIA